MKKFLIAIFVLLAVIVTSQVLNSTTAKSKNDRTITSLFSDKKAADFKLELLRAKK